MSANAWPTYRDDEQIPLNEQVVNGEVHPRIAAKIDEVRNLCQMTPFTDEKIGGLAEVAPESVAMIRQSMPGPSMPDASELSGCDACGLEYRRLTGNDLQNLVAHQVRQAPCCQKCGRPIGFTYEESHG